MPVDHSALHCFRVGKSDISLDSHIFVLKGEFSVGKLRGVIMSEPSSNGLKGVEIVVVEP